MSGGVAAVAAEADDQPGGLALRPGDSQLSGAKFVLQPPNLIQDPGKLHLKRGITIHDHHPPGNTRVFPPCVRYLIAAASGR